MVSYSKSTMKARHPTYIFSFTLLVVMLGYGMVLPIMPFYIQKLGAGDASSAGSCPHIPFVETACGTQDLARIIATNA